MRPDELETVLDEIQSAADSELPLLWRRYGKGDQPAHPLTCRYTLAWTVQASVSGGLSRHTQRRLIDLSKAFERNPDFQPPGVTTVKPGTEFRRVWKGEMHRVVVRTDGFEYDGRVYPSLSKVARQITGTQWSGPDFFAPPANTRAKAR